MKMFKECDLSKVVVSLFEGKTLVFPTETSYGLGCDATNQEAVNKIFNIKGRADDKPLLIVVPSVEMAKKYLVWNNTIEKLANAYWPGSFTIVSKYLSLRGAVSDEAIPLIGSANQGIAALPSVARNDILAQGVVSKNNTIAVRVSSNPLLKFLTESLGKPLVATSANISGAGDVYSGREAETMFADKKNQPDIILDYGNLEKNPPTTIVDATEDKIKILRQGQVKIKNI